MLHNFEDLRGRVGSVEPKTVAVACAHDGHTLEAVLRAAQEGILRYMLTRSFPSAAPSAARSTPRPS